MGTFVAINPTTEPKNYSLILFDGVCNLCNSSVNFLIKIDKNQKFKFASLQSEYAKQVLPESINNTQSVVYIRRNKGFTKSRAILEIVRDMKGLWPMAYFFIIIPFFIRDPLYDFVAKRRYKWYGQRDTCRIPTDSEKSRFIE